MSGAVAEQPDERGESPAPTRIQCPNCGRHYVAFHYAKGDRKPTYRCAGIGRGGGCDHVWKP